MLLVIIAIRDWIFWVPELFLIISHRKTLTYVLWLTGRHSWLVNPAITELWLVRIGSLINKSLISVLSAWAMEGTRHYKKLFCKKKFPAQRPKAIRKCHCFSFRFCMTGRFLNAFRIYKPHALFSNFSAVHEWWMGPKCCMCKEF